MIHICNSVSIVINSKTEIIIKIYRSINDFKFDILVIFLHFSFMYLLATHVSGLFVHFNRLTLKFLL